MLYYSAVLLRVTHADKKAIRECFFVHCLEHGRLHNSTAEQNLPIRPLRPPQHKLYHFYHSVSLLTMPKCRRIFLSLGWGHSPLNSSQLKNQNCHIPLGNALSPTCSWTFSVLAFAPDIWIHVDWGTWTCESFQFHNKRWNTSHMSWTQVIWVLNFWFNHKKDMGPLGLEILKKNY